MNRQHFLTALLLALVLQTILGLGLLSVLAQQADPELVPPDVTLPLAAPPQSLPHATLMAPGTGGVTPPGQTATQKDPLALITTQKGVITIRLFRKLAPHTVANFVELANKGFYNGLNFHRVESGFVIQGGCPQGTGSGLYIDPATQQPRFLALETHPSLRHNAPGVVAMARFGKNPHSASCQFYITLAPQPKLDTQYSVFGGVLNGMDVVRQIAKGDKIESIVIQEQQ